MPPRVYSSLNWSSYQETSTPFLLRSSSPSSLFLLAFFTLAFFILFPVHFHPRGGGGGCVSCPALLPAACPLLHGGQGVVPVRWLLPAAFSPCLCPAVQRRWPQALGKLLWPRRWLRRSPKSKQAASTPGPCSQPAIPFLTAHVPSEFIGWRHWCVCKPSHC